MPLDQGRGSKFNFTFPSGGVWRLRSALGQLNTARWRKNRGAVWADRDVYPVSMWELWEGNHCQQGEELNTSVTWQELKKKKKKKEKEGEILPGRIPSLSKQPFWEWSRTGFGFFFYGEFKMSKREIPCSEDWASVPWEELRAPTLFASLTDNNWT